MAKTNQNKEDNLPQGKDKRKYINQGLIPVYTLEEALKVPNALVDGFGSKPTPPFQVAIAIESSQTSSYWRKLSGSAVAYGLTDGGYNSAKIGLTELATKILSPTEDGVEKVALIEAALRPSVLKQFFSKYNNSKFPKDTIAENVLKLEFNVPSEDLARTLDIIKANGKFVGIIHESKSGPFVYVDSPADSKKVDSDNEEVRSLSSANGDLEVPEELMQKLNLQKPERINTIQASSSNEKPKVFISHGKNKKIVEQLKEILTFGQFDVTVSVEKESTAISVPDKVFSDMRNCNAAVIHIEGEKEFLDKEGSLHYFINENVLIEIGAAIALYGKKFILLCESSVKLPSNLQGLYRCNYEGKELSYDATMKLLKAFNEFRNS